MSMPHDLGERYSPLHFLAALGAGGIVVTFFMYLMFWVPHSGRPVPIFEDIAAAFATGGLATQAMIAAALAGIAVFSALNIRLTLWNLRELAGFRRTDAYTALRAGNAETQLLAGRLALAMTVNALFTLGLVFVPGLWSIVEYLFPAAMLAFAGLGIWALGYDGTDTRWFGAISQQFGSVPGFAWDRSFPKLCCGTRDRKRRFRKAPYQAELRRS